MTIKVLIERTIRRVRSVARRLRRVPPALRRLHPVVALRRLHPVVRGALAASGARLRTALAGDSGGQVSPRLGQCALPVVLMLIIGSGSILTGARAQRDEGDSTQQAPMALMEDRLGDHQLFLAPADAPPAPAPADLMKTRLKARELMAFAPYWNLEPQAEFDLRGLTTIAYFGVEVAPGGALVRDGNGWVGYQSQALTDLITRAHRAGTRVVLTAKTFEGDALRSFGRDPKGAAARLVRELSAAIRAKNFDGANLDFEGFGDYWRKPFVQFLRAVADGLHKENRTWQVTVDTYVSSAEVEDGFFDVAAIASSFDSLFVMGYDMYHTGVASPNAPLPRYESAIQSYLKLVPASKVIIGTPFYGYDWPTKDNSPRSMATGPSKPVPYEDIIAAGHPRYWDPVAAVPWTAYKVGNQWHEIYYDDPTSLALKARLADKHKLRGTGAWALGMAGRGTDLISALLGKVDRLLAGPAGPARPSVSTPTGSGSSTPRPRTSSSPKPKPKPSPSPSPSPSSSPLPLPIPTPI